jgi:hypothetical protein
VTSSANPAAETVSPSNTLFNPYHFNSHSHKCKQRLHFCYCIPYPLTMSGGASDPTSSGKLHLLSLPREIRNLIYGFLPTPNSCRVHIDQGPRFQMAEPRYSPPGDYPLIRTCKWFRAELCNFYFKAPPTNPVSLTLYSNKEDSTLSMLDYFMNSLTDECKKRLKRLVLVPQWNIRYTKHWREVITSLHDFNERLHKYPRITVIIRFGCIENVFAADWLSATLTMRHMSRFGFGYKNHEHIPPPVQCHQFYMEAQSKEWIWEPISGNVRFSILETMPREWIQARCNIVASEGGTRLLEYAESLWITGECTCKACESDYPGFIPCALETLLKEPSARIRSQPRNTAESSELCAVYTASPPNNTANDALSTQLMSLTAENLRLWNLRQQELDKATGDG